MKTFTRMTMILLFVVGLLTLCPLSVTKAASSATKPESSDPGTLPGTAEEIERYGFDPGILQGTAEDLWGNTLDLSKYDKQVVLVQVFSPAICGYCLVDGEFLRENYLKNNEKMAGCSFLHCLVTPQLDIYSYVKHYRETSTPVLTFPPMLDGYHGDGVPFLIAFRDGKRTYSGLLWPYTETFQSLRSLLWPGKDISMTPTSPCPGSA